MGAIFDPTVPGTFCLGSDHTFHALYFRRVERRNSGGDTHGGPNGNRPDAGIWWDVEITLTKFIPTEPGTTNPGHQEIVWRRRIDEGSWLSVVSSMGSHGEDQLTYGVAQALHRSGC